MAEVAHYGALISVVIGAHRGGRPPIEGRPDSTATTRELLTVSHIG
jgi:hypothetical protein